MASASNSSQPLSPFGQAALKYAAAGLSVFPLAERSKVPLAGSHGCSEATVDRGVIEGWWTKRPRANVAIGAGHTGDSQLHPLILDTDTSKGATLEDAARVCGGSLPYTKTVRTGTGGYHHYFTVPDGDLDGVNLSDLKNSAGLLGTGLDVRWTGGYVVAPPSIHPDTGQPYLWHVKDAEMVRAPMALIDAILTAEQQRRHQQQQGPPGGKVPPGGRNAWLTHVAGRLRRDGLGGAAPGRCPGHLQPGAV